MSESILFLYYTVTTFVLAVEKSSQIFHSDIDIVIGRSRTGTLDMNCIASCSFTETVTDDCGCDTIA